MGGGGERRRERERNSYLFLKVFRLICLWCTPEQPPLLPKDEKTEVKQDYENGIKRKGKIYMNERNDNYALHTSKTKNSIQKTASKSKRREKESGM